MKTLIAYVVWNKDKMIDWIGWGLRRNFKPEDVDILFLLDNPIDGTDDTIENYLIPLMKEYNVKMEIYNKTPQFKMELQNIALKYGIDNGYDIVICPQDDQKIQDPFLLKNIKNLMDIYGDRLGFIGGRDGHNDMSYSDISGSLFSHPGSHANFRWLLPGEFVEKKLLNDGPLIYNRHLIETVGYHDTENFKVFCSEYDYSMRSHNAGLVNINLGMEIVHEKFNCLRSNVYYSKHGYSQHDHDNLQKKWF